MIRKFRHFYKFRAAAALVPAIVVMMAVAGTHAAAQDETANGSPPAAGKMFRVAAKTLRPIAVIDRRDIEMSGLTNVGELLLSRAVFNSFGLHRPFVLGNGRAAVLVNGRRISDSTFDLDMLPFAAVERIEILDGSAARHGGHAIAGAVNIVLRRAYEGTEAAAGADRPGEPGGDAGHASAVWGGALGRGHLTFGVDHIRRQEVRDSDRDYSRAKWTPGGSFANTQGVSVGGNTIFFTPAGENTAVARPLGDCDGGVYTGPLAHPRGTGCGFAYADVKWHDGYDRRERESVFLNAGHPLGDDAEMYVDARAAQAETAFRYAPSVGTFTFTPSGSVKANLIENADGLTSANFPDDDEVTVAHRFVGHGNRDWRTDLKEYDLTLGLQGQLGTGLGYDAHVRYYRHEALEKGDTFVSESAVVAAIQSGAYDIANPLSTAPRHLEAIRNTGLRLTHDTVTDYRTASAALDGVAFSMPGGDVRWTAGMEVADEDWRDNYAYRDSANLFHEAGDVLGSAGNSATGERRRWSAFAEASIPLLTNWDLTLAGRRDDYDDVGEAFSWQVANSYRLNDALTLRASWNRGSRAPSLYALHALEGIDYPFVCDPGAGCDQVPRVSGGNPDLKPDNAESFGAGATASLGIFSLGADWFRIGLSDVPAQLSAQSIVDLDVAGNLPPGAQVVRDGGRIETIESSFVQGGETEITGIELRAGAAWETDWADLAFDARGLRTTRYESRVAGLEQPGDYPRDRIHASLRASRGGVTANWSLYRLSSYWNLDRSGHYKAWMGHDITLRWRGAFGIDRLDVMGGVLNVGDRGPSTDPTGTYDPATTLDSVMARTVFLKATLSFGP